MRSSRRSAAAGWARSIARDAKLNREVALKVLPEPVRLDPDRLARFTREAQLLASLNHPNIGAIYGLEESNGVQALVLELVEGPTLADRLAQGAIPLEEALPIAKQIADALESRARAGHRPSRSEAGEHQSPRRRHGEGAWTSGWPRRWIRPARRAPTR